MGTLGGSMKQAMQVLHKAYNLWEIIYLLYYEITTYGTK